MMRAILVLLTSTLMLLVSELPAQSDSLRIPLSLEEAQALAQEHNYSVRMARKEVEIVKSKKQQSNALFLPTVLFEETAVRTDDPLNVFGFRLKQRSVTQADFNPPLLNNPDAFDNFTTRISVQQPLINPDKFLERSAASYLLTSARESLENEREHLRFTVQDTYYRLILSNEQIRIRTDALRTAEAFEKQASDFNEQGIISSSEYLSAKVHRLNMQAELTAAVHQKEETEDELAVLLGLTPEQSFELTSTLNNTVVQQEPEVSTASENAMLRSVAAKVDAARQMNSSSKMAFLPSLNLFGSYEFNDNDFLALESDNYMIGASFQWKLFSGSRNIATVKQRKAEYQKAKIAYEQASAQHQLQVKKALRMIEDAVSRLELSEQRIEQAKEETRIRSDRYLQGLERTTDVLSAEVSLATSRVEHLQILYQYHTGVALLEYLTEQDFN